MHLSPLFIPTSRVLTLPSWPVCDCGWQSCHTPKNPRSPRSRVPPAPGSPPAADASWEELSVHKHTLLSSFLFFFFFLKIAQAHTLTHTHTHTPPKNDTGDMGVRVREGAFIPTSLSLSSTHPLFLSFSFFFFNSLAVFSIPLRPGLTLTHPSPSVQILPPALTQGNCLPLPSLPPSHEFLCIFFFFFFFFYHHPIPEHRGLPATQTLCCSTL